MKTNIMIHRSLWFAAILTLVLIVGDVRVPGAARAQAQAGEYFVFAPILHNQFPSPVYVAPVPALYCSSPSLGIPDNDPQGAADTIAVSDVQVIADLDVYLDIGHSWVGDLVVSLTHQETGRTVTLVDRPGVPAGEEGCKNDNISAILDDDVTLSAESRCNSGSPAVAGAFTPNEPLSAFDGELVAGNWTLAVSDLHRNDVGDLNEWCVAAKVSEAPPPPAPVPTFPDLPSRARVSNISGLPQALPLDCESRSAVDWAGYFGVYIDELKFFNQLPKSDNPDKGFVGNVYGAWGQVPPNSYGIHAEPVAELLRAYGLEAYAHRPMSWDALRAEIAAGRPVFVWVIGAGWDGVPVYYTPADWLHTVVARYQHTVIVTAYTPSSVTILNGSTFTEVGIDQFLESWSVLGNMAITATP